MIGELREPVTPTEGTGTRKPRLLDLFCGAGGAAMGYHRAGFEVVGVDIAPQPNYPFEFVQMDALDCVAAMSGLVGLEAIHASPPCQAYSTLATLAPDNDYPDLYEPTRDLLEQTGLPWVIENVIGAPYRSGVVLCGSMFGLRIRRHRNFESNVLMFAPPCDHGWQSDRIYPALNGADRKRGGRSGIVGVYGNGGDKRADLWPEAMEINWMTRRELTQR